MGFCNLTHQTINIPIQRLCMKPMVAEHVLYCPLFHEITAGVSRMKFRKAVLLVGFVALFGASCNKQTTTAPATNANTATKSEATPDPFAATRGVFAKNCQSCHGVEGDRKSVV